MKSTLISCEASSAESRYFESTRSAPSRYSTLTPPLSTVTNVLISLFVVTSSPGWSGTRSANLYSPGVCGIVCKSTATDSPFLAALSCSAATLCIFPLGVSNNISTPIGCPANPSTCKAARASSSFLTYTVWLTERSLSATSRAWPSPRAWPKANV